MFLVFLGTLARILQSNRRRTWKHTRSSITAMTAALGRHASAIRAWAAVCLRAGARLSWSSFRSVIPPSSSCRLGVFVSTRSAWRAAIWFPCSLPQHRTGRATPITAAIRTAASIHCCADLRWSPSDPQLAHAAAVRLSRRFCLVLDVLNQWPAFVLAARQPQL